MQLYFRRKRRETEGLLLAGGKAAHAHRPHWCQVETFGDLDVLALRGCEMNERIVELRTDPDFEMEMRARRPPGASYETDGLPLSHLVSLAHEDFAQVRVVRQDIATVIDKDCLAVTSIPFPAASEGHLAIRARENGLPLLGGDVQTTVKNAPTVTER